jgi:predicted deacylase
MHREYIHVRNVASQISLPLAIQWSGQRGSLTTEAAHEGIPIVSIEMRGDIDQADSQAAVEVRESILNFMRLKDIIPGEKIESSVTLTGRMQHINVDTEGFFVPRINLGEPVQNGNVIGTVQDKVEVVSPFNGVIVSLSRMNYVFDGDIVARVAPLLTDYRASEPMDSEEPVSPRRKW